MFCKRTLLSALLFSFLPFSQALPADLNITLAQDSEEEQQTAELLRSFVEERDVDQWIWTTDIIIDETQIPHSHPVLTVRPTTTGDNNQLYATFLHEQFHWFFDANKDAEKHAISILEKAFPEVPVGYPEGARDAYSTYLHLMVCMFEYQAMEKLIGLEQARELIAAKTYYKWIYQQVLAEEPAIYAALEKSGLSLPE